MSLLIGLWSLRLIYEDLIVHVLFSPTFYCHCVVFLPCIAMKNVRNGEGAPP